MNDSINYYELLGIKQTATTEEIKQAYKSMMKKWHPDVNKDENASKMSVMLNEAKVTLLDDIKRREYDEFLKNKTNKTYENMKEHATKNRSTKTEANTNYSSYQQDAYREEKTYTKWEYFRDYMKFYPAKLWFKIFVFIGVILESLICSVLQIINFIVTFLVTIIYSVLGGLLNLIVGLLTLAIIVGVLSGEINGFKEWFEIGLGYVMIIIISALPELIITFLTEKMPNYLARLNIFLFKCCVGYKN